MKILMMTAAIAGAFLLSGCTPEQMETTPVVVQTAQGPVTCQLYTLRQVTWDRAINHPGTMDVKTADNVCRNEGYRILKGEKPQPAAAGTVVVVDSGL